MARSVAGSVARSVAGSVARSVAGSVGTVSESDGCSGQLYC